MKKVGFLMLMGLALAAVALLGGANLADAGPGGGTYYANSPAGVNATGDTGLALRKFIDAYAGVGSGNANNLGQYLPIAVKDPTNPYPGSDYYHIALVEYTEKMHSDLPKQTRLRGYRDLIGNVGQPAHYLGPVIVARRDKAVRLLIDNRLNPDNAGGKLFIPVDLSLMGAGNGPPVGTPPAGQPYLQNRTSTHLHGGLTPWISDGTPHQWMVPLEDWGTSYPKGVSFQNVPGMPAPANGSQTLFWTNQQSNRLQFYHEHALGITRLGVYVGIAAGYLITDQQEDDLMDGNVAKGIPQDVIPGRLFPPEYRYGYPLVIQDKTFVPKNIGVQDALWSGHGWGTEGDLWFPHVYEANQDPLAADGSNPFGRWDYGPWFWPPQATVAGPLPVPTATPESFMDTPVINGTAYPYLNVERKAYRFRILNAANDRFWNLQLYYGYSGGGAGATASATVLAGAITAITPGAAGVGYVSDVPVYISGSGGTGTGAYVIANVNAVTGVVSGYTIINGGSGYTAPVTVQVGGPTEVKMVPAIAYPGDPTWPNNVPGSGVVYPTDSRIGGVPDWNTAGPKMIQIGTEGGFLPNPVVIPNQPVTYETNPKNIVVGSVKDHALFLGPAERADVIIDFSQCPAGSTLILYNDSPAPVPAIDVRVDYFTGNPDYSANGGAPSTAIGMGPNTRTIMQFRVGSGAAAPAFSLANLQAQLPVAYAASQPPPIVPQLGYVPAYPASKNTYAQIFFNSLTFTPVGGPGPKTIGFKPKAIQELFDPYGRMNSTLGLELPFTNIQTQTTIPLKYLDPPTEIMQFGETQLWKITHNGVDTHAIHFHLFNVQVINRVGWDNAVRAPDANELGWKETVRMNPLEDIIIAIRPERPYFPFAVPDSIRLFDPTSDPGTKAQFTGIDINGNPITVTNMLYNFGWEYVWHCHLLGHEENDMMRPIKMTGTAVPQVPDYLLLQQ